MTNKSFLSSITFLLVAISLNIVLPLTTNTAHLQAQEKSFNFQFDLYELLNMSQEDKKAFLKELKDMQIEFKEAGITVPQSFQKLEKLLKQNKISEKELQSIISDLSTTIMPVLGGVMESMISGLSKNGNIDLGEIFKGLLNSDAQESNMQNLLLNNLLKFGTTPQPEVEIAWHTLNDNQIVVAPIDYSVYAHDPLIKSVELTNKETRITIINPVHRTAGWVNFSSNTYLMDVDNNEKRYAPIGLTRNVPLDSILVIKNHDKQMVEFTLLFPPLENRKSVKQLILVERPNDNFPTPNNVEPRKFIIPVKDYTPSKKNVVIRRCGDGDGGMTLNTGKGYPLSPIRFVNIKKIRYRGKKHYKASVNNKSDYLFDASGKHVNR